MQWRIRFGLTSDTRGCDQSPNGGVSDNNRKARFYELTAAGRRQLTREAGQWRRLAAAIAGILGPDGAEG